MRYFIGDYIMRILYNILIALLFMTFSNSICSADDWDKMLNIAKQSYPTKLITYSIAHNGIKAIPESISFGPYFDHGFPTNQIIGTKMRAACITGISIEFTNTSNNVISIDWNNSVVCLDGISLGYPFLDGMKYIDVGKPNILSNDILPPGTSITRRLSIPRVKYRDGDFSFSSQWFIQGAILFRNSTRKFDYYISLVNSDNSKEYLHIDVPPISSPIIK